MQRMSSIDSTIQNLLQTRVRHLARPQRLEFLAAVEISERTLNSILSGKRGPSKKLIDRILQYFAAKDEVIKMGTVESLPLLSPRIVHLEATAIRDTLASGDLPSMISTRASDNNAAAPIQPGDTVVLDTLRGELTFEEPVTCGLVIDGRLVFRKVLNLPDQRGFNVYSDKAPVRRILIREMKDSFVGKVVAILRNL